MIFSLIVNAVYEAIIILEPTATLISPIAFCEAAKHMSESSLNNDQSWTNIVAFGVKI
jgi:hypothetical protein